MEKNISTSCYYHKTRSINKNKYKHLKALFSVRSWNNGAHYTCFTPYLWHQISKTQVLVNPSHVGIFLEEPLKYKFGFSFHVSWLTQVVEILPHETQWIPIITAKPSQIAKFMGPTRGPPGSCWPQLGPMLAPWTLLSGMAFDNSQSITRSQGITSQGTDLLLKISDLSTAEVQWNSI